MNSFCCFTPDGEELHQEVVTQQEVHTLSMHLESPVQQLAQLGSEPGSLLWQLSVLPRLHLAVNLKHSNMKTRLTQLVLRKF